MSSKDNVKIRTTLWMEVKAIQECDANLNIADCRTRSEYIQKAVEFYNGYVHAGNNADFLCEQIAHTVNAIISNTENRIARMQFKEAVELAKITHMIAPLCELDDEQLRRLHIRCVDEVKRINGAIRFDRAVEEARGD